MLIRSTDTIRGTFACLSHLYFWVTIFHLLPPKSYRAGIQKWFINNLQTFCHLYRLIHFIKRCAQWANPVVWRRKVRAAPCNKAGEMSHQQEWGLEMKNARTAPRQNLWFGESRRTLAQPGWPTKMAVSPCCIGEPLLGTVKSIRFLAAAMEWFIWLIHTSSRPTLQAPSGCSAAGVFEICNIRASSHRTSRRQRRRFSWLFLLLRQVAVRDWDTDTSRQSRNGKISNESPLLKKQSCRGL